MPELTIDASTLELIRTMNAIMGTEKAARAIHVSRETLARVLAGLRVRNGTTLLILESLKNTAIPPGSAAALSLNT